MTKRLTSAQIIALGDYLRPDFDPTILTVSQLLGLLGYHNVTYPTPYSKSKLIQCFEEEIKYKADNLRKERLEKANSIASDDGITDGLTGKPLGKVLAPRRSSRRLSKIPAVSRNEETSPLRPEPVKVKRRRSSAQPALEGTSSRRHKAFSVIGPIPENDSDSEEFSVEKVGRTKRKADASSRARQLLLGEDSGWEDNNIFQSGAEDSSPVRPSPARQKASRKSVGARKSRKSFSAPPPPFPYSSPTRPEVSQAHPAFSPQAEEFESELPFLPYREFRLPSRSLAELVKDASPDMDLSKYEPERIEAKQQYSEPIYEESPFTVKEAPQADEQREAISRRVAASMEALHRRPVPLPAERLSWLQWCILVVTFSVIAYHVHDYKVQSSVIGYCDTGTRTSQMVENLKARRLLVRECNRQNRTTLRPNTSAGGQDLTVCPLPPLLPIPEPESCTPCPEHATCSQYSISCDTGYLLHPNPLVFFMPTPPSASNVSFATASSLPELAWGLLSDSLNGLPGFGSIALPPRCLEDPNRRRLIGVLGRNIENTLGKEHGKRVCAGGKVIKRHVKESDGGEAKKWGVELLELKTLMRKKTFVKMLPAFEDTFNDSIRELVRWGGVIIGEDAEGHQYLAHKTPEFTWGCALLVRARKVWAEWKSTVFVTFTLILGAIITRLRYVRNKSESRRVGELVQIALDTLRNQEFAHHVDPVTAVQPYLSSLQLRDLILQEEHSVSMRKRLWDRVERVVEGNANVRVNIEEVEGGDELRVWRWVGSSRSRRFEGIESDAMSPYASSETPAGRS